MSNVKLCVFPDLAHHPLKALLNAALCTTVNSDDPAVQHRAATQFARQPDTAGVRHRPN
jgi:adenosine deaminase